MNRDKNLYTIIYASVMVVIVAILLTFTSTSLRTKQRNNEQIDKMQQILRAVNKPMTNKTKVIDAYRDIIKQELLVKTDGTVVETFEGDAIGKNEAFKMNTANQFKLLQKEDNLPLPLYVAEVDGKKYFVLPLNGAGLWGPIWGYLSVDAESGSTVFGSDFSHASETPGLGAEIAALKFSSEFKEKNIFRENEFKSISVVKPGQSLSDRDYVDGISGGTLTSNGVNDMLLHSLMPFKEFLIKNKQQQ